MDEIEENRNGYEGQWNLKRRKSEIDSFKENDTDSEGRAEE